MSTAALSSVRLKKSQYACARCKQRKRKCDGRRPACKNCVDNAAECVYESAPSLSYTTSLENRIIDHENLLRDLVAGPWTDDKYSLLIETVDNLGNVGSATSAGRTDRKRLRRGGSNAGEAGKGERESDEERRNSREGQRKPLDAGSSSGLEAGLQRLQIDDRGTVGYHGPTSIFYPDPEFPKQAPADDVPSHSDTNARDQLRVKATEQRDSEWLAYLNLHLNSPFPYTNHVPQLLEVNWCWTNSVFNFTVIYRPAFTQGMAIYPEPSPYFSPFLLRALILHGEKFRSADDGTSSGPSIEQFNLPTTEEMVAKQLQEPSSVTGCQGLILLAVKEASRGDIRQAWAYSGMSFRMLTDLGIHLDGLRSIGDFGWTVEDLEVRKRIFWSAYVFDKLISMYLGRTPAIHATRHSPSQDFYDDSDDSRLWIPVHLETHVPTPPYKEEARQPDLYQPLPSHSLSTFRSMAHLSQMLESVLLWSNGDTDYFPSDLVGMEQRLRRWWQEQPEHLRVANHSQVPPPHIATLNCLYLTLFCLLYRLQQKSVSHHQTVVVLESASSIIHIVKRQGLVFGYRYLLLLHSYCVFCAAETLYTCIESGSCGLNWTAVKADCQAALLVLQKLALRSPGLTKPLILLILKIAKLSLHDDDPLKITAMSIFPGVYWPSTPADRPPSPEDDSSIAQAMSGAVSSIADMSEPVPIFGDAQPFPAGLALDNRFTMHTVPREREQPEPDGGGMPTGATTFQSVWYDFISDVHGNLRS